MSVAHMLNGVNSTYTFGISALHTRNDFIYFPDQQNYPIQRE